jgi:hypothetical protein
MEMSTFFVKDQTSSITSAAMQTLMDKHDLDANVIQRIMAFVGAPQDLLAPLQRLAETTVEGIIHSDPDFEEWRNPYLTGLAYAITHSGLSFQLGCQDPEDYETSIWPRTSQFITGRYVGCATGL